MHATVIAHLLNLILAVESGMIGYRRTDGLHEIDAYIYGHTVCQPRD